MERNYPLGLPLRDAIAALESGDCPRLIRLCRRYEKDLFLEVNVTLFDVQNLTSSHPCFKCKGNDALKLIIGPY